MAPRTSSKLSRADSDLTLDADRKFGGHVDGGSRHTPLALTSSVPGLGMTQLPSWITSAVEICLHRVTVPLHEAHAGRQPDPVNVPHPPPQLLHPLLIVHTACYCDLDIIFPYLQTHYCRTRCVIFFIIVITALNKTFMEVNGIGHLSSNTIYFYSVHWSHFQ